jgi:diaminohydroxyphosphoribosylaminopyrimidine deaminase/5-amino-6-(5-phosphoribosylamino)uracil reductase
MNLSLPSHLKIFNTETKTIIFNKIKHEEDGNLKYYKIDSENIWDEMMSALYLMNIQSVLIEGGGKLLQSFIHANLWDEARITCNEKMIINEGINAPELNNCVLQRQEKYLNDTISYYQPMSGIL